MKPKLFGIQIQFRNAKLRQPTGHRLSNVRKQQKNFNWANLILMLSSNLNSKQLRFHGAHPKVHIKRGCISMTTLVEHSQQIDFVNFWLNTVP